MQKIIVSFFGSLFPEQEPIALAFFYEKELQYYRAATYPTVLSEIKKKMNKEWQTLWVCKHWFVIPKSNEVLRLLSSYLFASLGTSQFTSALFVFDKSVT